MCKDGEGPTAGRGSTCGVAPNCLGFVVAKPFMEAAEMSAWVRRIASRRRRTLKVVCNICAPVPQDLARLEPGSGG
jgi:hypothetical protein